MERCATPDVRRYLGGTTPEAIQKVLLGRYCLDWIEDLTADVWTAFAVARSYGTRLIIMPTAHRKSGRW
jgi:hypothetical protein